MENYDLFEVDTKQICLLCLVRCENGNDFSKITSADSHSLHGFKQLLRYLNVNFTELFNCGPQLVESMLLGTGKDVNIKVSLCSGCSSQTSAFDKVYNTYELLRLQLDDCVKSIFGSMKSGLEVPDRVKQFDNEMKPKKMNELVNASIVSNLRSETLKKCAQTLKLRTPRVALHQVNNSSSLSLLSPQLPSNIDTWLTNANVDEGGNEENLTTSPVSVHPGPSTTTAGVLPSTSQSKSQPCKFCPKTFQTGKGLYRHMLIFHPERIPSISKQFSHVRASLVRFKIITIFKQMFSTGSEASGYKCSYCDLQIGQNKHDLKYHVMLAHHDKLVKDIERQLKRKQVLEPRKVQHQQTLSVVKTRKCPHCPGSFTSKWGLNRHIQTVHLKPLKCPHCSFVTGTKPVLSDHKYNKHAVEFSLEFLPEGTSAVECQRGLDAMLVSLDKMNGQCPNCIMSYERRRNLWNHLIEAHFNVFIEVLQGYLQRDQVDLVELESDEETGENQGINSVVEVEEPVIKMELDPEQLVEVTIESDEEVLDEEEIQGIQSEEVLEDPFIKSEIDEYSGGDPLD